jgi:hypothetical protein
MNLILLDGSGVARTKTILEGEGHVIFPDMAIDNSGNIHMAYIRESGQGLKSSSACYYAKLPRLDPR